MKAQARLLIAKLSWIDDVLSNVWLCLFALMLIAVGVVLAKNGWTRNATLLLVVIAATFSYPLYTFGFKLVPCLVGNILYIALVAYTLSGLWPEFPGLVYLLSPIIVWVATASVYVSAQIIVRYG